LALIDAILLFELGILIPRIISRGSAMPPCLSVEGFLSLVLSHLGQQRRLILQVVDFDPSNLFFSARSAASLSE
jgi:hypothetical protein